VLGVAVLGSVFSATGALGSPGQFTTGLTAALTVSAVILAASALVVLLAPETRPARQAATATATGLAAAGVPGMNVHDEAGGGERSGWIGAPG
jgi:methylthioribose-1-phosphate isomerase